MLLLYKGPNFVSYVDMYNNNLMENLAYYIIIFNLLPPHYAQK